ncbi:MAG: hypothetical protein ACRC6N_05345, partial [Plesiomonas sp.]|uniref:hypothetical protein n=1 Tax=Plesiomonas sp. TaxID=2486279 RepID=UPI003F3AC0FA
EDISNGSRVMAVLAKYATSGLDVLAPPSDREWKILLFFDNYLHSHSRELISVGLVPIGQKSSD